MPSADDVEDGTREGKTSPLSGTIDFSRMLHHAAFNDAKDEKDGPLFSDPRPDEEPILRIRALQHMTIIHLQRRLAVLTADIISSKTATEEQMDRAQGVLKDYVSALRDLKFTLEELSGNPKVAEFLGKLLILDGGNASDLAIMMHAKLVKEHSLEPLLHVSNYTGEGGWNDRLWKEQRSVAKLFNRIRMALFGGVVVVAPMLIMALHRTLLTTLLTTSLFVLVVGLVLAWLMDTAEPKDIVMATAAYAAILVVFVGTTLPA